MTTLTPERRHSPTNVAFQRRYSRVYEQPVVEKTAKGLTVRVDDDTYSETSSIPTDGSGKVLNPEASLLGNLLAKVGVASLAILGVVVSILGSTPLLAASQLFGFIFLLLTTFAICCGLYLWWGSWHHRAVVLDVNKVLVIYAICSSSDILARLMCAFTRVPVTENLPFEASYFLLLGALLYFEFSFFAHGDGLNAMFAKETNIFVGLTLMLNLSAICLFGPILPSFILPQLIYTSALLGLTLSLMGHKFPHLSPSAFYWALSHQQAFRKGAIIARVGGGGNNMGRKMSTSSMASTNSSVRPRSSYSFSSLATMGSYMPPVS